MLKRRGGRWPEPRPEFLGEALSRFGRSRPVSRSRMVAATVAAVAGLMIFAGLGGVGSAIAGVSGTVKDLGAAATGGSAGQASGGAQFAAAETQYQYPAWVCLSKTNKPGVVQYKLIFSEKGKFGDGWVLVRYYGQTPGPCPPA